MKPGSNLARILRAFVCVVTLTLPTDGRAVDCAHKFALIVAGVPALAERTVTDWLTIPVALVGKLIHVVPRRRSHRDTERQVSFWHTGRGPLEYMDLAGLYTYDFRNKQVLDVASGNGRFGQLVNLIYGHTGTKVTGLDIAQGVPYLSWGIHHIKGDAFKMPVADKSQDLVINNWMMTYFLKKNHEDLKLLLDEHLRVANDGGEIRVGFGFTPQPAEGFQVLADALENHPRVESYQFVSHFPVGKSLRIKLKPANSEPRSAGTEPGRVEWKRQGVAMLPITFAASTAGLLGYKFWPTDNTIEKMNLDFDDLEDEIAKTDSRFMVNVNARHLSRSEIGRVRRAIAVMKKFFKETPKEEIIRQGGVLLFDNNITEPVDRGGVILIPTSNPESAFALLKKK